MKKAILLMVATFASSLLIVLSGLLFCRSISPYRPAAEGLAARVRRQLPSPDGLDAVMRDAIDVKRDADGFITALWASENTADSDLVHLTRLPRLRHLGLTKSRVTDRGVASLGSLPWLTSLHLQETTVSGWGLSVLTSLETLSLRDCRRITDDDLLFIGRLRSLTGLSLTGTAITDSGLHHLAELSHLEVLHIGDTRVTETAAEAFRRVYWPRMEAEFGRGASLPIERGDD